MEKEMVRAQKGQVVVLQDKHQIRANQVHIHSISFRHNSNKAIR